MVVVHQVGVPLVGLGAQETVEAVEAPPDRPVAPGGGHVHLGLGAEMPLAHHVGVPTQLAQDLGQGAVLRGDHPTGVGEPDRRLGDARHAVAGVVAPGQQARPGRRAQRRGVPLRVAQPPGGDPLDVGHLDRAAIRRSSPRSPRRPARCRPRSGRRPVPAEPRRAPSPGTESRMSTLTTPWNGLGTTAPPGRDGLKAAQYPTNPPLTQHPHRVKRATSALP